MGTSRARRYQIRVRHGRKREKISLSLSRSPQVGAIRVGDPTTPGLRISVCGFLESAPLSGAPASGWHTPPAAVFSACELHGMHIPAVTGRLQRDGTPPPRQFARAVSSCRIRDTGTPARRLVTTSSRSLSLKSTAEWHNMQPLARFRRLASGGGEADRTRPLPADGRRWRIHHTLGSGSATCGQIERSRS